MAIRCAHCGKEDSREGFLGVGVDAIAKGVRLKKGDVIAIECARELGFAIPVPTHPPLTFRAW